MNDELVKRLRQPVTTNSDPGLTNAERRMAADAIEQLMDDNEQLRCEVETWKDRVEAEQQAHEATIKEFQRISND